MRILVSACLLGFGCRYDGGSNPCEAVMKLSEKHTLIPFCPEIYGGLPTPRNPSERSGQRVMMNNGTDVTKYFRRGAKEALKAYRGFDCECAILKENSPSCGSGTIYDGSFSGMFKEGYGITAELFREEGIPIYGESEIDKLQEKGTDKTDET